MKETAARPRHDEGFTLIELLIVIVILGILAAVVVFSVGGVSSQGKKSACLADISGVQTASDAYYAKNLSWAVDVPTLVNAKFLRSAPGTGSGYTITYTAATGVVSSTPACSTLT